MAHPTTRNTRPAGTPQPLPGPAATRAALPEALRGPFDAALPGARAAVLARLLGALDREPLPGIRSRGSGRVTTHTGSTITFPATAAAPFAAIPAGGTGDQAQTPRPQPDPSEQARTPGDPGGRGGRTGAPSGPREQGPPPGQTWTPWPHGDPGDLARSLWPDAALAAEIDNSVANLALARAANPHPDPATALKPGDPDGLGRLEQLLIDGHPLHPCCRTRGGMSTAEVLAYAPEHHPVIRLRRLRVPAGRWHGDTEPVLYAHPWQADHLQDTYPWLQHDGHTEPVRPLMSLRTVAPLDGGDHYKTAVDIQMTSAVRTVSPAAVHNGPRLSALLTTLTAGLPLTVLGEYGAGAVIVDGQPQRHLAHLRRQAPHITDEETVVPLGVLAVPGLLRHLAGSDPYAWFGALARVFWTPAVTVLDRGVALEAHGQNTLVVLRDGQPQRILYRDLGGVRVSARRLHTHGVDTPELVGDLPSDDPAVLRTKLAAAALSTVAAQLIALLAADGADPQRLWGIVAAAIRAAGTADVPHLLNEPLPVKAMTAMRLAADPLQDVWTSIDNPMAGLT